MSNLGYHEPMRRWIRHECGHLISAKALGFTTHEIRIGPGEAAASLDLLPSLRTMQEAAQFCEARIQILFAGVLAESLHDGDVDYTKAVNLLESRFRKS
jgi:hypothetical protein